MLKRSVAIQARPWPTVAVRSEEHENGGLEIVVRFQRSGWQRFFGAPPEYEKIFRLDMLGREVYEACDGQRPVKDIVARFARRHQVSFAEAEKAVTTYIKTLMMKGLIQMAIDRED